MRRRPAAARPALRSLGTLAVLLAIYFAIPERVFSSAIAGMLSVVILVGGGVLLIRLVAVQVRHQVIDGDDGAVQLQSVLLLAYLGVIVFALGYFFLARSTDDQFADLDTKIDALYFTVSTLGTVGYGDIHPTGQAARAIVTAQIVFNLVFYGVLARLLTGHLQERRAARRRAAATAPGDPEPDREGSQAKRGRG